MHLTIAGWLLVALPIMFCGGVWVGVRIERAQQMINRSRQVLDPLPPGPAPVQRRRDVW